ncbi:MAG: chemotaxis protein CheW [Halobacteriales archaeon]
MAETAHKGVQVLEFRLGEETYSIDIDYVAEIVDMGDLTEIPNSPAHVEGVMDLRGRTTSIINPKTILNISDGTTGDRIVVFDPDHTGDQGAIGWIVDDVYQVVEVDHADVDDPSVADEEAVKGVIKKDDEFVVWLDPDTLHR